MGMRELLLILISFGLGLVCVDRIRSLDRYEREPFGKMVLVTLFGGGCALVVANGLFAMIDHLGFHSFESYVGSLLVIGPVEELAKLIGLLSMLGIIGRELNEPADGIIYMACVALGFSLIENILYAVHPANEHMILVRLLTATPLHICFSALMGLSFYLWYRNRHAFYLLLTGYLLASISHGFYDLMVFNHYSILLMGATILLMYGFTRNLFIYALAVSPHRISLAQTIGNSKAVKPADTMDCPHCGSKEFKRAYAMNRFTLLHCEPCDHFTISLKGIFRIIYHFAGVLNQKAKREIVEEGVKSGALILYEGDHIRSNGKWAAFRLHQLDAVLEKQNYAQKLQMKSKWYLPNNLFRLAQPGEDIDYPKMVRDGRASLWRRLVYPFSSKRRRTHRPPNGGPFWQWAAFFVPELWFAMHRLWGVLLVIAGIYLLAGFAAVTSGASILLLLGIVALATRIASGYWGSRIYFRRHGRWP